MADFPTSNELFRVARDEVLIKNSKLTREVVEREATDANVMTNATAAVGDEVIGQLARVCASLTLGVAKGRALDRLIFDRYGLLRRAASPAVGSVEFSTAAPAPGAFSIPQGVRLQTSDGIQYLTTASASYPAGSVGPIVVAVRSTAAGVDQQAAPNTITNLVSTIPGSPSDLAVNNPLATAGASDEEEDEDYRDRARLFFTTVRRGTLGAIEEQALRFPGVLKARAFEDLDSFGRPAKVVQLVIADQYTDQLATLEAVPPTYAVQSQQLTTDVFNSLEDTRAAGIFVEVIVAQVILQSVVLALSFEAGVNVDSVALQARVAVVNAINDLAPGATLTTEIMVDALKTVRGLIISSTGNEILSPSGDVVPTQLEVLRSTTGLVTASTVQPDRTLAGTANPDVV